MDGAHFGHGIILRSLVAALQTGMRSGWRSVLDVYRLRRADAVLVSFPKSGRTFVRVMLARLFQRQFGIDERDLLKFSALRRAEPHVPRLLFSHAGDAMRRPEQIRIRPRLYRGKKLVLLVRHPGDVAVSRYYHLKHRSTDLARQLLAEQPLESFVWTRQGGIPAIVEFLNQWAALARERGDVLILRYEDFLSDPHGTLRRLGEHVGLDSGSEAVADAVEFARIENLRRKEREGYFQSPRMGPGRSGENDSFKVRSGKAGGYRSALGDDGAASVDAFVQAELDPVFGYGN